jgi:hypothetical protein
MDTPTSLSSHLEQAQGRLLAREYNKQVFKPPRIRSLEDIKQAIAGLDRAGDRAALPISGRLSGRNEEGRDITYQVSGETRSRSLREILAERLRRLTGQQELAAVEPVFVNGRLMLPQAALSTELVGDLDVLVSKLLAGYREGTLICWHLADGCTYKYDLLAHRLVKVVDDGED